MKSEGNLIINMAVPIKDKDCKVIGVLIGNRGYRLKIKWH
jgi:hypothetical protein